MFQEIFYLAIWANIWIGLIYTLHTQFPQFKNYSNAIQNNAISMIHSLLSCLLAAWYLHNIHSSATVYLYNNSISEISNQLNHSTTLGTLNTTVGDEYSYYDLLKIYN